MGVPQTRVNLGPCSALERLHIWLEPQAATDEQSLDRFKAIIRSCNDRAPPRELHVHPYSEEAFTRQGFADLLGTVAAILEEDERLRGPHTLSSGDGEAVEQRQHRRWRVWVDIHDRAVWQGWWTTHIRACFPTFAKSRGLAMNYSPRECSEKISWLASAGGHSY